MKKFLKKIPSLPIPAHEDDADDLVPVEAERVSSIKSARDERSRSASLRPEKDHRPKTARPSARKTVHNSSTPPSSVHNASHLVPRQGAVREQSEWRRKWDDAVVDEERQLRQRAKQAACGVLPPDSDGMGLFRFRSTVHHGLPANPTCMAYDRAQRLMAVANSRGLVKVFGCPGVEVVAAKLSGPVSHLCFCENFGFLVAIFAGSKCEVLDLKKKRSRGRLDLGETGKVTCISHCIAASSSPYVYVGTSSGLIRVVQTRECDVLAFGISPRSHLNIRRSGPVVAVQSHPVQPSLLLIVHQFSVVAFDLQKMEVNYRYGPLRPSPPSSTSRDDDTGDDDAGALAITSACWHSSGRSLAVGFEDGTISIWELRQESPPTKHFRFNLREPRRKKSHRLSIRSVQKIYLTDLGGHSLLVGLGGTSTLQPDSIVTSFMGEDTLLPLPYTDPKDLYAEISTVVDMVLCSESGSADMFNCILAITDDSRISAFQLDPRGAFPPILRPQSTLLQDSTVTCSQLCQATEELVFHLGQAGRVSPESKQWPLHGGVMLKTKSRVCDLLITGHSNGTVLFWDVTSLHLKLLYSVSVESIASKSPSAPGIESICFCVTSRVLAITCVSGEAYVLEFSTRFRRVSRHQYRQRKEGEWDSDNTNNEEMPVRASSKQRPKSQAARSGSESSSSSHSAPQRHSTTDVATPAPFSTDESAKFKVYTSDSDGGSTGSLGDPQILANESSKSSAAAGSDALSFGGGTAADVPFSWERFFLAANLNADIAFKYAQLMEKNRIDYDQIEDLLDLDMLGLVGISAVGDKMRVVKYIKSGEWRSTVLPGQRVNEGKKRSHNSFENAARPMTNASIQRTQEAADLRASADIDPSAPRATKSKQLTRSRSLESVKVVDAILPQPELVPSSGDRQEYAETVEELKNADGLCASEARKRIGSNCDSACDLDSGDENGVECDPGFQVSIECMFQSTIVSVCLASALKRLAVGDRDGNVGLFNLETGACLVHKSLGQHGRRGSGVSWLAFDETSVRFSTSRGEGGSTCEVLEASLYVAMEDGSMHYIGCKDGQVKTVELNDGEGKRPSINSVLLLDKKGNRVDPCTVPWEEPGERDARQRKEKAERRRAEQAPDMSTLISEDGELIVRNLDLDRAKKEKTSSGRVVDVGQKYILICSSTAIEVFSSPGFRRMYRQECSVPPVAASVCSTLDDQRHFLAVFDATGDLHIYRLLDLQPVYQRARALQNMGMAFRPSALDGSVACSRHGAFVMMSKARELFRASLFAQENQLNLPASLPALHIRNLPFPPSLHRQMRTVDYESLFHTQNVHERDLDWNNEEDVLQRQSSDSILKNPSHAITSTVSKISGVSSSVGTSLREQLLGRPDSEAPELSRPREVHASTNEIHEIMQENIRKLQDRGDRLKELQNSSEQFRNNTSSFLEATEALNNKSAAKKKRKAEKQQRRRTTQASAPNTGGGAGSGDVDGKRQWWEF